MQSSARPPSDPNVLRILVVGESKVGKTLLIRRLCHQVFSFSSGATPSKAGGSPSKGDLAECDTSEEEYYFATQWGPTIGFAVDCLVRDAYNIREAVTQHGGGINGGTNSFATPAGGGSSHSRYLSPTALPEEEMATTPMFPKTPTAGGGGGVLTRRCSSVMTPGGAVGGSSTSRSNGRTLSLRRTGEVASSPTSSSSRTFLNSADLSNGAHPLTEQVDAPLPTPLSPGNGFPSPAHARPVTQSVELYELGGTHTFSQDCTLPLPLLEIDGIIFVYDRANTGSTTRLAEWYSHMKKLFAAKGDPDGRRPRLMLIGTQLSATSSLSRLLSNVGNGRGGGSEGASVSDYGDDYFPSDEALMDPEVRLQAQRQLASRRKRRSRSQGFFSRQLGRILSSMLTFVRLACHPSLILSEQYQEERSTRSFRCLFRILETFAAFMMWTERVVLYAMAVVLFGFYQDVVQVKQPSVRASLDAIKEDRFFSAQCHVCHLYDRFAFESAAEELTSFFDTLHREKLNPTSHAKQ